MEGILVQHGEIKVDLSKGELERLQIIVGQLLQVPRLVLLLGSGCSHLGSPRIRAMAAAQIVAFLGEDGDTLASLVEKIVGDGVIDLEQLLGALSAAISLTNVNGATTFKFDNEEFSPTAIRDLRTAINASIVRACDLPAAQEVGAEVANDPLAAHRDFFNRLLTARRSDLPSVRIFTTNYDLVIEKALDDAGVPYIDGFVGTVNRIFRPNVYDQEIAWSQEGNIQSRRRVSELVYLYKLHGSINWRSTSRDRGHAIVAESLQTGNTDLDAMAVIYPTPQKEGEVLGFPYSDLMRAFSRVMSQPETLLVTVGYGWGDEHINRVIAEALEGNPSLQLMVIEPYANVADSFVTEITQDEMTRAARIAHADHPRVSVVAGEIAQFTEVAEIIPYGASRPSAADTSQAELAKILLAEEHTGA